FLHIGFLHLFMNMLALYFLGVLLERIYGTKRLIVIFILSGFGGSLTGFALSTSISPGASAAFFGLFDAYLFFVVINKYLLLQTMCKNVIFILILHLVIGIVIPNIDMSAHIGGLITGFLAATITSLPKKRNYKFSSLAIVAYAIIISILVDFGINSNEN